MRLLLAEFWRFWTRRLVLISVPLMIVLSAAVAVPVAMNTLPVTAAEQAKSQTDFDRDHANWAKDCPAGSNDDCALWEPTLAEYQRTPLPMTEAVNLVSTLKMTLVNLICLLIGASFIAAEFRSGTMSTWLTFNPNRLLVYATKLAAAALSLGLATALAAGAALASLGMTSAIGGGTSTLPGAWELIGWNAVGGALFTAIAVAIGFLTRHTAAALGIGIGVNFLEGVASLITLFVPGAGSVGRYLPSTQLGALFNNGTIYYVPSMDFEAESAGTEILISAGEGALYWLALAAIFTAVGMLVFYRRGVR